MHNNKEVVQITCERTRHHPGNQTEVISPIINGNGHSLNQYQGGEQLRNR